MKRPYPKDFYKFFKIACRAKLSHPEGRALHACNRQQMGWPWVYPDSKPAIAGTSFHILKLPHRMTEVALMRRTREDTAIRWEEHWKKGGSIRRIGKPAPRKRSRRAGFRRTYNS